MYSQTSPREDFSECKAACDAKYIEGVLEHLYYALSGVETECISVDESGVTVRGIPEYIVEPFRPLIFAIHRHYSDPALRPFISRYLSRISEAIREARRECHGADGGRQEKMMITEAKLMAQSGEKERAVISGEKDGRTGRSNVCDCEYPTAALQSSGNFALESLLIAVQDEERMFADIERATSIVYSSLNALQELNVRQNEFADSYVYSSFVREQAKRRRDEVEMWMNYGEVLSEEELPRASALAKTRMIVVNEAMDPFSDCFWKDNYRMRETGIPSAEAEAIEQSGKMVLLIRELVGREVVVDDSEELIVLGGNNDDVTRYNSGSSEQGSNGSYYEEKEDCEKTEPHTTSVADCSGQEQSSRARHSNKLSDGEELRSYRTRSRHTDEEYDEAVDNEGMISCSSHTKETNRGAVCGRKIRIGRNSAKSRSSCGDAYTKRIKENDIRANERVHRSQSTEPRSLLRFRYGIDSVQKRRYELCSIFREELGDRINAELDVLFDVILMRDLSFFHHMMHELGKDLLMPLCDLNQKKTQRVADDENGNAEPGCSDRPLGNGQKGQLVDSERAKQICRKVLFAEPDGDRRDLMKISIGESSLSEYILRLLQSQRMPAPDAYITLAEALVVGINSRLLCFFFSQRFFAEIEMLSRFLFLGNFLLYQLDRKKKYNFVRTIYLIIRKVQERRSVKKVRIEGRNSSQKDLEITAVSEVDEMVVAVEKQVRELVSCFFLLSADVFSHISQLFDIALEYILLEYPEDVDVDGFGRRVRETVSGLVETVRRECGECELYEFLISLDLARIL